ncbi:MAG: RDD family protein [Candidatus Heimdallarchaeota archaeon]
MSKERIELIEASMMNRILALAIDAMIGIVIAIISHYGAIWEYDILWSKILPFDLKPFLLDYGIILWFVIFFPIYHIFVSGLLDGQSIGKLVLGLRVVTTENESTKRAFLLHLRRFFFLKQGTKVVKEYDPGIVGL